MQICLGGGQETGVNWNGLDLTSFELSAQLTAQSWIQVHDHKPNIVARHRLLYE